MIGLLARVRNHVTSIIYQYSEMATGVLVECFLNLIETPGTKLKSAESSSYCRTWLPFRCYCDISVVIKVLTAVDSLAAPRWMQMVSYVASRKFHVLQRSTTNNCALYNQSDG